MPSETDNRPPLNTDAVAAMLDRLEAISKRRDHRDVVAGRVGHFLIQLDISHINEMFARWGENQARDILVAAGGSNAGTIEGQALLHALAVEAAGRIARTLRALYLRPGALDAEARDLILNETSAAFRKMLARSIAVDVPLSELVENEKNAAEAAEASAAAAEEFMDAIRAAGVAQAAQRSQPQPVDPRAEDTSPAPDSHLAQATADVPSPAHGQTRVYRHDEAGTDGPAVHRIPTEGEKG